MNDKMKDELNVVLLDWLSTNCDDIDWGFSQALVDLMCDAVEAVFETAVTLRKFLMGS